MADFFIKQGDTAPKLSVTLKDENNAVVPLTAASSVVFHMYDADMNQRVDAGAATIDDAANGKVSYQWQAADTAVAGKFFGEFEVTWNDGTKTTFPNYRYLEIVIRGELS